MGKHIVIIGNGISGITAARHIRKLSDYAITVISSETHHFYSRPALMYLFMGDMTFENLKPYEDGFWKKNKITLVRDHVQAIDTSQKQLTLNETSPIHYDELIIATGSLSNKFGWPGQDLEGVCGFYSMQDLEYIEKHVPRMNRAVIVGGGLIGIELAEMLLTRHKNITFLVRENAYWSNVLPLEESEMINDLVRSHHIDLKLKVELKSIQGDEHGHVQSVETSTGEILPCEFVGLTAGVRPNIEFVKNTPIETERGILVDEFLETNIPGIYAIGDCAQHRVAPPLRRPVEQVWYTGRMMGETVAQSICGSKKAYNPGIWFNSAKFFDLEYQTYGRVLPQAAPEEAVFFWKHPEMRMSLRLVFNKSAHNLLGVNVFGIRLRQEVCQKWIQTKTHIAEVIDHFHEANFDPEFFKRYETRIKLAFKEFYSNIR